MASRGVHILRRLAQQKRCLCSQQKAVTAVVSVDDGRVQELILRMTGMDFERVFTTRREPLTTPQYKLMSMEELREEHAATVERAKQLLKMTPVLPVRTPQDKVIEKNDKLMGATEHTMIFTDISQHKENEAHRIVAREPDGTLREASWAERDRMCQAYFPLLGRKMWLPPMLRGKHLERLLRGKSHLHVLEVTCVQCEPDSEDSIRVHHVVYEDIATNGCYDILRSTRHFGGLVWYLSLQPHIDGLLKDMLQRFLYENAADLIELHLLCQPGSEFSNEVLSSSERLKGVELVKAYCTRAGLPDLLELLGREEPAKAEKTEDELIIENMTAKNT